MGGLAHGLRRWAPSPLGVWLGNWAPTMALNAHRGSCRRRSDVGCPLGEWAPTMALTPVWAHARDFHFLGEFDEGVDRAWIFHLNAVEFDIGSSRGEWEMDVFSFE